MIGICKYSMLHELRNSVSSKIKDQHVEIKTNFSDISICSLIRLCTTVGIIVMNDICFSFSSPVSPKSL